MVNMFRISLKKKKGINFSLLIPSIIKVLSDVPSTHWERGVRKCGCITGQEGESREESTRAREVSINLNPLTERHRMYFLNKALIRVTSPLVAHSTLPINKGVSLN